MDNRRRETPSVRKAKQQIADQAKAAATRAEPPGGSVAALVERATGKPLKPTNGHAPPDSFDDPAEIPEPTPNLVTTFRLGDDLDPSWRETPEAIDHAGENLGMVRMAFEDDASYTKRIEARIALDRST